LTKDDILQALRLTAMGRAGHPLQEQLAEKLAEVFAPKEAAVVHRLEPSSTFDKGGPLAVEGGHAALAAAAKKPRKKAQWAAPAEKAE